MSLTYENSADLMRDPIFISRIKVACLKFAAYITDEAPNVPAHNTRLRWAGNTLSAPDVAANAIAPAVVMDQQVQLDGAEITDEALQTVVENSVNRML
jgi:hypothetical protein